MCSAEDGGGHLRRGPGQTQAASTRGVSASGSTAIGGQVGDGAVGGDVGGALRGRRRIAADQTPDHVTKLPVTFDRDDEPGLGIVIWED